MDEQDDVTEPLPNGAKLPDHPANTTARKIVKYNRVWDDSDGRPLTAGLSEATVAMLMSGEKGGLGHLYHYAIRRGHIFHTRSLVNIDVRVVDV